MSMSLASRDSRLRPGDFAGKVPTVTGGACRAKGSESYG